MSQVTSGVRGLLSYPLIYDSFQSVLGVKSARRKYVSKYIRPNQGSRLLDIGCGTGQILNYLPESVEYHGYDLSQEYIDLAMASYGERGFWHCASVSEIEALEYSSFDIVMANGVLHHLDDRQVKETVGKAALALKSGGRFCSLDGCFIDDQNPIARFLVSQDRGRNVRSPEDYQTLISPFFDTVELTVRHDMLRLPYTHAILVGTKADQR